VPATPAACELVRTIGPRFRRHVAGLLGPAMHSPEDERSAIRRLACRAARVHVTDSHVDVIFSIDAATIDVRLAGLDRDPGWLARFGRVIQFHYR
jgi:hypothetical protein